MKNSLLILSLLVVFACTKKKAEPSASERLNAMATQYVKLGLVIGQYDPDFVDAYYGPDSLKPMATVKKTFPKDSLLQAVNAMITELKSFDTVANDTVKTRAKWIGSQLRAFDRRIKIFSGEYATFDEESKDLYGVVAPTFNEDHFKEVVNKLNKSLPGKGNLNDRFQKLANRFIIPKAKLDTVFKTAIAECRKRTLARVQLPANENFKLEYVNNKPWNGYNWYKGNYQSVIQINTDLQIFIDRAIDVGSHESYPGHHVYNMLLEKDLYNDKKQIEISLYPLYSPQSFIAEGTANEGIDVVFPGDEKIQYAKSVLLPLAGLDTAGVTTYFSALEIRGELNYARNEVARGLLNGTMDDKEAMRWLKEYGLYNEETALKSIAFIRKHRSYVINYNYGKDLASDYIKAHGGDESADKRWEAFLFILRHQVTPADLK